MMRSNVPHDVHDQSSYLTFDHHASSSFYEDFYPQSQTQPLRLGKAPKDTRIAPLMRPPSLPPLFFEQDSGSYSPSFEEECATPIPSASLKRSSHIRRKEGPRRSYSGRSQLKRAPLRIVTDPSLRLSQQSTPPLSPTRSLSTPSPISAIHAPSSMLSLQDPHVQYTSPENEDWPDSPGSIYSETSMGRSHSGYVEWDSTGFLQPQSKPHYSSMSEEDDIPRNGGALLTRQGTELIVDLLRLRRQRAGQD